MLLKEATVVILEQVAGPLGTTRLKSVIGC